MSETEIEDMIKQYRSYRLKPFLPILKQIKEQWGDINALCDKDVLELGPGTRVGMMRWLQAEIGVASIQAAGVAMMWPWTQQRRFIQTYVTQKRFLDYVKGLAPKSLDLVYSRLVFEQHSIDPFKLLASPAYWQQFKKKDFKEFDASYPASVPNLQMVFKQLWSSIKPGGAVISFVGKRKYSALDTSFLESFKPTEIRCQDIGPLSRIITVVR